MSQFFRDTIYSGDANRDWTILWDRGDPHDPGSIGLIRRGDTRYDVSLVGIDGVQRPVKDFPIRQQTQVESWHWRSFRVNAPVGTYQVFVNDRPRGNLRVVPKSVIVDTMKLGPGERTNSLSLKPNTVVRGYGTFMTGNLALAAGCSVTGLTIDGNVTGTFDNCVFDSCTFRRGIIGPMLETDRGTLFRDCRFENVTVATCSSGCFLRCKWDGPPASGWHNFVNERATRLAVINCTMNQTDRGIICRSMWGDSNDNLYAGLWFNNIAMTNNGGELICREGSGNFDRNLFFCLRQSGCVGGVMLFDGSANDNIFDNIRVPVDITGLARQSGNTIRDSECDYVHINWPKEKNPDGTYVNADGAVNTLLQDVACVGFRPSARGLASGDPKYFQPGVFAAVVDDGSPTPSTIPVRVTVRDQAAGFAAFRGMSVLQ